ncbi:MAG: hypothetical protein GKR90_16060 [Pseudomonadales bacterium]|nr:hypothetical protein [Pseudomonadales bacterium]
MIKHILLVALLLGNFSASSVVFAAEPDPFEGRLLPLELAMSFRKEIDLSKDQNRALGKMVVALQKSVAEKQWQMQAAYFDLIEELDEATIDEDKTLSLVETAVGTENLIKLEQIRFLIRVRNMLNSEQIAFLRDQIDHGWTEG